MTIQELRVVLQEWFCGCGSPDMAADRLRDLLALHPLFDHRPEFEALIPDEGLQCLILYTLDHFDLTEHGGTVGGGWLTKKGKAVLAALQEHGSEKATEQSCYHGYSIDGSDAADCPECAKLN
jgi:hypothetical protein